MELTIPTDPGNDAKGGTTIGDKEMKLIRDTAKKVMELDRQFKIFTGTINIDKINKDINKLTEQVITKASGYEFNNQIDTVSK